jgi:tetratricopeptide (TPR) repeat protein
MNHHPGSAVLEPPTRAGSGSLYADVPPPVRAEAVRRLSTRIETLPDSPWVEVWRAQRELFELNDRAASSRLFRVLSVGLPETREAACHELALVYRRRGEHRRALSFYERAGREGKSRAAVLVGMAETRLEMGDRDEAERLYRDAAARLDPAEAPLAVAAGCGLAGILSSDGRAAEARALLSDLYRDFPFRTELRRLRSQLAAAPR